MHTPTPWIVSNNGIDGHKADETFLEVFTAFDKSNAARIVKCVNMHDELVAVLRRYTHAYPAFRIAPIGADGSEKRIEQMHLTDLEDCANSVLAKAKGDA